MRPPIPPALRAAVAHVAALATLTTQGRAVGYSVVAALQDPRKEVLNIRNLFPDKVALRLDEPSQVDLVLGDRSTRPGRTVRSRSSSRPRHRGWSRLSARRGGSRSGAGPGRVRSSDDDIRAMTAYDAPRRVTPITAPEAEVA